LARERAGAVYPEGGLKRAAGKRPFDWVRYEELSDIDPLHRL